MHIVIRSLSSQTPRRGGSLLTRGDHEGIPGSPVSAGSEKGWGDRMRLEAAREAYPSAGCLDRQSERPRVLVGRSACRLAAYAVPRMARSGNVLTQDASAGVSDSSVRASRKGGGLPEPHESRGAAKQHQPTTKRLGAAKTSQNPLKEKPGIVDDENAR